MLLVVLTTSIRLPRERWLAELAQLEQQLEQTLRSQTKQQ